MKIAIIGSGIAGLSLTWYLKHFDPNLHITVFDPEEVKNRTSALAFLLHPFISQRCQLNWKGREAFAKSRELIEHVSNKTKKCFFKSTPLLKLSNYEPFRNKLKKSAMTYVETKWAEETQFGFPGVWIESALQLNASSYLFHLESLCKQQGVIFKTELFNSEQTDSFDQIIYTTGSQTTNIEYFKNLPFSKIKGQILKLKWNFQQYPMSFPITAYKCHALPSLDSKYLYVGSTYERNYNNAKPNLKEAMNKLWPHLVHWLPQAKKKDIVDVSSGIRLNAPHRLPIIYRFNPKIWLYTAMGSKGLLYHAYLSEILAKALILQDPSDLPQKVRSITL